MSSLFIVGLPEILALGAMLVIGTVKIFRGTEEQ